MYTVLGLGLESSYSETTHSIYSTVIAGSYNRFLGVKLYRIS